LVTLSSSAEYSYATKAEYIYKNTLLWNDLSGGFKELSDRRFRTGDGHWRLEFDNFTKAVVERMMLNENSC
jgi:hypothetical protein